jgi:hypothetical protein
MKRTKQPVSPIDRFEALTGAEKDATVAPFDQEFVADKSRPLTAAERRRWNAFRKRTRSKKTVAKVSVQLEHDLVQKSDELAREQGLSRAELIARSLRAALALAGK